MTKPLTIATADSRRLIRLKELRPPLLRGAKPSSDLPLATTGGVVQPPPATPELVAFTGVDESVSDFTLESMAGASGTINL